MTAETERLGLARERASGLLACLQDLVRLRSVNGRDSEAAVAQRLAQEAARLGLPAALAAADPARPNVVVSWGDGPAGFAFIGHMDTVAEGDAAQWTHPPFAAEVAGGRLYGRGTADNKAGLACGLYALALLRDQGRLDPSRARVLLAGVVDEESGASSRLGVRYLLDQGRLPVQGAIYTYASDIVCIGHRGLLRLTVTAHGQSTHTGSAEWSQRTRGVNAVTGLAGALLRLERLEIPAPPHPAFEGLDCTMTPGTLFQGGEFESIVPATATALVDVRLMPGQAAAEVIDAVRAALDAEEAARPGLRLTLAVKNSLPAAALPLDHPLALIAQRQAQAITGRPWPIAGAGPANEGYMLIEAGIATLPGFGPEGGSVHAPDEWVSVGSLAETVAVYAGVVEEYLGRKAG